MSLYIFVKILVRGTAVACFSLSPYFGIFGVLLQALAFAGLLCYSGVPFFALVVTLIYVGGMIIIFLFSAILRAERYPESGFGPVLFLWLIINITILPWLISSYWLPVGGKSSYGPFIKEIGLSGLYDVFAGFFIFVGAVLLVALVIVLVLGFEHGRKKIRKL